MDGAMGTEIMRRTSFSSPQFGEAYNLTQPELIRSIHRSYLDAGADVLLTNTFQANPVAERRHDLSERHHEIWSAAIGLAHLDHPRPHYVLADVGPIENLTSESAEHILNECVGVDGILLETWSSLDDLKPFLDRRNAASPPLLVSFTFHRTEDLLTFRSVPPEQCAREAKRLGVAAIGANCGQEIGMVDMLEIVKRYRDAGDLPIFIRPNAGSPTLNGCRYPRTPAALAAALPALLDAGVAMVGGCCGTTPEHIARFRAVVDDWTRIRRSHKQPPSSRNESQCS
jgi:methionine synthase I (cobalamin-dependent)